MEHLRLAMKHVEELETSLKALEKLSKEKDDEIRRLKLAAGLVVEEEEEEEVDDEEDAKAFAEKALQLLNGALPILLAPKTLEDIKNAADGAAPATAKDEASQDLRFATANKHAMAAVSVAWSKVGMTIEEAQSHLDSAAFMCDEENLSDKALRESLTVTLEAFQTALKRLVVTAVMGKEAYEKNQADQERHQSFVKEIGGELSRLVEKGDDNAYHAYIETLFNGAKPVIAKIRKATSKAQMDEIYQSLPQSEQDALTRFGVFQELNRNGSHSHSHDGGHGHSHNEVSSGSHSHSHDGGHGHSHNDGSHSHSHDGDHGHSHDHSTGHGHSHDGPRGHSHEGGGGDHGHSHDHGARNKQGHTHSHSQSTNSSKGKNQDHSHHR